MKQTGIVAAMVCVVVFAGFPAAWAGNREDKARLEHGVTFAKARLAKLGRDKMATLVFQSTVDQGGSILTYIVAGIGAPETFPRFELEHPTEPWTVVIKSGKDASEFIVEGYGTDLTKPQSSATVQIALQVQSAYSGKATPPVAGKATPSAAGKTTDTGSDSVDPPLTVAASDGKLDEVKALLAKGANVNALSGEGATALMYAVAKAHLEVVKALLAARADVNAVSRNPQRWSTLMFAVKGADPEIVGLLLQKGADVNVKDSRNDTALMLAAMEGQTAIVELLLKAGAKLEEQEAKNGNTALLLALSKRHGDTAVALLKAGADANLADSMGVTPLMLAAGLGQVDAARELVARKADVNAKMTGGNTPGASVLMQAAGKGSVEIVKLLLENGADRDVKDAKGNTARRYADANGHAAVVAALDAARPGAKPVAPPQPAAAPPAVETLIGKTQQEADAAFGKPIAKSSKGNKTIIFYQNGEVQLEDGKIVRVNGK